MSHRGPYRLRRERTSAPYSAMAEELPGNSSVFGKGPGLTRPSTRVRTLETSLKGAKARLTDQPTLAWPAADVRTLVNLCEEITQQRTMLCLSWARDAVILLLAEGAGYHTKQWESACDIAREVLERVEDLLHIAGKDGVDPKMLKRLQQAGFAE